MKTKDDLDRANHIQACIQNAIYGARVRAGTEGWAAAIADRYGDEPMVCSIDQTKNESTPSIARALHQTLQDAAMLCERLQTRGF